MIKASLSCLAVLVPLCLVWACGSTSHDGDDSAGGGSSASGGSGSGSGADGSGGSISLGNLGGDGNLAGVGTGVSSSGGSLSGTGGTLATELCGDVGCTCSNGVDDDEDGLIDGFDPECTGPFDNDEGSFATGIPGDNRDPKWQDCFFDGNSGAGDDHCRYSTGCLTGELAQDDPKCALSQACLDFCAPRTPNGCDCFGCCTIQLSSGDSIDIQTGSDCSLDQAEDAAACPVCVKSDQCGNDCGRCELCPGKTVEDLPEDCSPSGTGGAGNPGDPGYTCDNGLTVCGPGLPSCAAGKYCSLGCCLTMQPR